MFWRRRMLCKRMKIDEGCKRDTAYYVLGSRRPANPIAVRRRGCAFSVSDGKSPRIRHAVEVCILRSRNDDLMRYSMGSCRRFGVRLEFEC